MIKFTFLLFLFFSLISCGKDGGSSSTSSSGTGTSDSSDSGSGPVNVREVPAITTDEYSPLGLSDKVIDRNSKVHAPMDIISQELKLTFDTSTQKTKGASTIKFRVKKTGRPYFELQASTLKNLLLDTTTTTAISVTDPDGQNQSYWSIEQEMAPGEVHEVQFEYELPAGRVSFSNGGVGFLTDMTDLNGKFFEYWGPTGFEGDAFALNLVLTLENSTSVHQLFTNGEVTGSGSKEWKITFPDFFSKSSFYVHLTNSTGLTVKRLTYKGLEKEIPIEIYGSDSALVNSAVIEIPKLFKELEGDYGGYPHGKYLAYMNKSSGGMEYVGATITSLGSLDHELLHSWFARSVIPADGRSGWIDEAMASWRDYGYTKATSTLNRSPTNLANYSPFRKTTPSNSYVDGRALMAELNREFDSIGGLKPVMKVFFQKYKNRVMTNEEFWSFLETQTGMELGPFNDRYAMGEAEEAGTGDPLRRLDLSKHPTPLTEEEVLRLR